MVSVCHVVVSDNMYGAANVAYNLAKFQRGSIEVHAAVSANLKEYYQVIPGVTVHQLPLNLRGKYPSGKQHVLSMPAYFSVAEHLKRMSEEFAIDVMQFHLPNSFFLAWFYRGRNSVMITVHGPLFETRVGYLFGKATVESVMRKARIVTAVDDSVVEELQLHSRLRRGEITVIPNGVNRNEILYRAQETPEDSPFQDLVNRRARGELIVSFVGRLQFRKGQDTLLKALPAVIERAPKFHCYLIGDGPEREGLVRLVRILDLKDYVTLTGYVQNPYPYIREADLVISDFGEKGHLLVQLEAISLGRAVLCGLDPVRSKMFGNALAYAKPEDPNSIAEAMTELLNNGERRKALERKALQEAPRFDWEEASDKYSALCESVAASPT